MFKLILSSFVLISFVAKAGDGYIPPLLPKPLPVRKPIWVSKTPVGPSIKLSTLCAVAMQKLSASNSIPAPEELGQAAWNFYSNIPQNAADFASLRYAMSLSADIDRLREAVIKPSLVLIGQDLEPTLTFARYASMTTGISQKNLSSWVSRATALDLLTFAESFTWNMKNTRAESIYAIKNRVLLIKTLNESGYKRDATLLSNTLIAYIQSEDSYFKFQSDDSYFRFGNFPLPKLNSTDSSGLELSLSLEDPVNWIIHSDIGKFFVRQEINRRLLSRETVPEDIVKEEPLPQ